MEMNLDLLCQLEKNLQPHNLEASIVPITVLGYGDISLVFKLDACDDIVFKRLPIFKSIKEAEQFSVIYNEYTALLTDAGLKIPPSETATVEIPGRNIVVLYLGQQIMPPDGFANQLVHRFSDHENKTLMGKIVAEISKVWDYNKSHSPGIELALDSQMSNWVLFEDEIYYVDTSTPLFRKNGEEPILDYVDSFLESVPAGLRWAFRKVFINEVIPRYYVERNVFVDISSNLNNERPEIIPMMIDIINQQQAGRFDPITEAEVARYYAEDRRIWLVFLALRRFDRWVKTHILRKRYEFTLPIKSSFSD